MLASFPKVPKTYSVRRPRKSTFLIIPLSFDPYLHGTSANIRINLILSELRWATSSLLIVWVYLHSNFRGRLRKTHVFWNTVHNGPSRSSKVIDFGTNRKRVYDFLLIINSNLAHILPRFRDIAGFLLRRATPPLYFTRILGVFPLNYTVSGKKSLQYFMCNCNKFKDIFIIFGTNHPESPLY